MFAKLYQYFADMPPAEVIPPTKRLLDAAHGGHADVVLELLQSGVGFNVVNESGNKPIHIAAYEGHVSVLKLLLDAGASVNEYGRGNNTPLHFAARNNHVEAVKFLMSRGADATSQNWRGLEPAQVTENKEIGRIIYEHARRGGIPLVHEAPPPAPTKASDFTLGEGSELPDIIPSDPGVAVPGRAVRKAEPSTTPPLESSPRSLPQASPLVTIDLVEDKPPTVPAASEVTTEPAATDSQPTA